MTATSSRSLRVRAFAKINLSLRVLGVHDDGYHEIRTTFQSLALHDTLTLTPTRRPFTIECDDPACPADESNLVWKGAELLWRADGRRGRPSGVTVAIMKRIPMQAGLGGGSSDAAAALRGLARLWKLRLDAPALQSIARRLGADVAYFLEGGTALGAGRGDILYPLARQASGFVVLVVPSFGVSTREAYGWWDAVYAGRGLVAAPANVAGQADVGNDLEPAVVAQHPEVGKIVKQLTRLGAFQAAMSGSGSAVFGLFPDQPTALDAAEQLGGRGRVVLVTRMVGGDEYARLSRPA